MQYEPEILDICLKLLQVSPQHGRNWQKDYLGRADPVYLSRVVSAMVSDNASDPSDSKLISHALCVEIRIRAQELWSSQNVWQSIILCLAVYNTDNTLMQCVYISVQAMRVEVRLRDKAIKTYCFCVAESSYYVNLS